MKDLILNQRALVKMILQNPLGHGWTWTIQGLGMLRLYLNPQIRLHVWSDQAKTPEVSELHNHPWGFSSLIVAGRLTNTRYHPMRSSQPPNYMEQTILCGSGGGLEGSPRLALLYSSDPENYFEGDQYAQTSAEIHQSTPDDGTVTIITRTFGDDVDHAKVYWPIGQEWVSAEPRVATDEEVVRITQNALDKWF